MSNALSSDQKGNTSLNSDEESIKHNQKDDEIFAEQVDKFLNGTIQSFDQFCFFLFC